MTTKPRAAIGAVSACAVLIGALVGPAGAQETDLDGRITNVYASDNGMTFQKVSHPENGLETADGVVDYIGDDAISAKDQGQGDRGQSYSYAAESAGDWVYIGTMYGGLGVQAILKGSLSANMGMSVEEATALIQTLYAGNMYLGEPDGKSAGGVLFKFNVKTGETKILMSQSEGVDGGKGVIPTFRSAFKMNGKLYFEGMVMDTNNTELTAQEIGTAMAMQNGFPCIYEVDPADGDRLTKVYDSVDAAGFRELVKQNVFMSTRAIGSFRDALIAGDLKPTADGNGAAYLVASKTPSVPGSYKVIADMASFDDLPAIHRSGVNGGGGIYQVLEFNGRLYVVVCTGSRETRDEQTGTLRSFAIYVGENSGDPTEKADWTWRPLVGDTSKGAKYTFGLDASRVSAGACTLQVYNDHLYIGDYNDVSSALQGFALRTDFVTQATNLAQSINLYRMDRDEHVEMLVGDPNETFPDGGTTGLGSGYGNHMNQYTWQTTVHEGRMYLSTMNTTTLLEPIVQFTNGDVLHMSEKDWNNTVHYLRTFVELILNRDTASAATLASEDGDTAQNDDRPRSDDADALVDWAVKAADARLNAATLADMDDADEEAQHVTLSDAQRKALVDGINDGSIVPGSLNDEESAARMLQANDLLTVLGTQLDEKASEDFAEMYEETEQLLAAAPQMPENLKKIYETLVKLLSVNNLKAFFKSLPYLAKSKRGFNLFEISEQADGGVNVTTVADDGFGDPFNHGLRIFVNTDDHMLIGTANPFYGTQLWRVANTMFPVHVTAGIGGTASADRMQDVAPGTTVTLTATPDEGYRLAGWKVTKGGVEVGADGTFAMPGEAVYVEAVFERADGGDANDPGDTDKPGDAGKPDATPAVKPEADGAQTPSDATTTPADIASTGSSIALALAAIAALALAGVTLLASKRATRN